MERILLASTSPRRKALLRSVGLPFRAVDPRVDERDGLPPLPADQATVLAERKVRGVLARRGRLRWVLGCDTLVDLDGAVLGKPEHRSQARGFLSRLAGREHCVHSGVALFAAATQTVEVRLVTTRVRFRGLTEREIEWYLDTGEWPGAAGAYRIQGRGALLVASLSGSYSNVVGLPLESFCGMLVAGGYRF